MSKSGSNTPNSPSATAGKTSAHGGGAGKAPSSEAASSSATDATAPGANLDPDLRERAAKIAKCSPEEVIGAREYADKTVVVIQTASDVVKREFAK